MNRFLLKFWNRSFRLQLIYAMGFVLTLLIVTFTYITTKNHRDFLYAEGLEQAQNRSLALATTSKVWVMANDYIGLDEIINNFSVYDDLVFATVINMEGKIIAHTDTAMIGQYIADEKRISYLKRSYEQTGEHEADEDVLLHNKSYIDIVRMIHNGKQHLGMVHLRLDQNNRQQNIDDTILQGTLFTFLSLILTVFFAYLTANSLVGQLMHLIRTMKKVRHGNKSVRASEEGVRELSILSSEFNSMLEALDSSEKLSKKLQERLELAFRGSHDGLWDWNIIEDTIYFSPEWKEMPGYKDDELAHDMSSWTDHVHPDDINKALRDIDKHLEGETEYYENIHRLKHRNGQWIWTLDRAKALFDEEGKAYRMVGTHRDITKEKEMQLRYAHQAQIIEQTNDSVISTDLDGNIINWNTGSKLLFGYKEDEVVGKNISVLYPEEDMAFFEKVMSDLKETETFSADVTFIHKSRDIVWVALSLSVLRDEEDKPTNIVYYAQDVRERKKVEKELLEQKDILDHQAHHDILTALPNRLLFNDRLSQAIAKAKRRKEKFALFFIDLDQFKQINDSLGHDLGDEVLQIVSDRLNGLLREVDTLARLGGDEFTMIIENLGKLEDASRVAKKILAVLSQPMSINDHTLYVSSSIGISFYPEDDTNAQNLLKYADAAMYKAKDEGRNNFQFYSAEMTERAFEHVAMEASLRQALEKEEFIVYYQPQMDGIEDKLIGMEALVRWKHPTMGLVSPVKFIPIAEETGLIVPLDQWVMKTAMRQIVQWYEKGFNPGVLALNLAMKQLQQKNFITMFEGLIQETGCKPEWLELEVTEGQIMLNPEDAVATLSEISDMGIELAIDDFGTGYSSLSYLKRLPIDKLKIDQSFVRELPYDEEDAAIAKAVIALSQSLNLSVIAEGVETAAQKDFLIENGCKNIQGYFYGRPMPAEEMKAILESD